MHTATCILSGKPEFSNLLFTEKQAELRQACIRCRIFNSNQLKTASDSKALCELQSAVSYSGKIRGDGVK